VPPRCVCAPSLLDRLVNHAGEVSITRARIDADVRQLQGAVNDLTDNLDRLRSQLRDIELQAETQITSRIEAAKAASQSFDPLEMDRFTRFQELTRMMAESVNDVATVQRSVQRTLQSTEDELAAQARLTASCRTTCCARAWSNSKPGRPPVPRGAPGGQGQWQAGAAGHRGGSIEVDRGVLERMVGPFEHLLRNSVAHGIETPAQRQAAGKDATGEIRVTVTQEGNEIGVDCRDDGAGLDLARIRQRGRNAGLLAPDQEPSDADLANLIFLPGFSTATEVTELAGRGVGLDVVRAEVNAMGGRIETASTPGQGTASSWCCR
jgi:chemosensory pili system protein ChpA (sensor histidine kinase/response regulator)